MDWPDRRTDTRWMSTQLLPVRKKAVFLMENMHLCDLCHTFYIFNKRSVWAVEIYVTPHHQSLPSIHAHHVVLCCCCFLEYKLINYSDKIAYHTLSSLLFFRKLVCTLSYAIISSNADASFRASPRRRIPWLISALYSAAISNQEPLKRSLRLTGRYMSTRI